VFLALSNSFHGICPGYGSIACRNSLVERRPKIPKDRIGRLDTRIISIEFNKSTIWPIGPTIGPKQNKWSVIAPIPEQSPCKGIIGIDQVIESLLTFEISADGRRYNFFFFEKIVGTSADKGDTQNENYGCIYIL